MGKTRNKVGTRIEQGGIGIWARIEIVTSTYCQNNNEHTVMGMVFYIMQVCEKPIVTSDVSTFLVPRKQANIRDVIVFIVCGKQPNAQPF